MHRIGRRTDSRSLHGECRELQLHADGDRAVPFEQGRLAAGLIPHARLVPLHSTNHILLADEPAWPEFLAEELGVPLTLVSQGPAWTDKVRAGSRQRPTR